MDELYKRIKQRREELGITQDELAKKVGYKSRSTIAKIESGVNDIPQSKIKEFAEALSTTPKRLMGYDTKEEMFDDYSKEQEDLNSTNEVRHDLIIYYYNQLNRVGRDSFLEILSSVNVLNDRGLREAVKRIEELTHIEKYTTDNE